MAGGADTRRHRKYRKKAHLECLDLEWLEVKCNPHGEINEKIILDLSYNHVFLLLCHIRIITDESGWYTRLGICCQQALSHENCPMLQIYYISHEINTMNSSWTPPREKNVMSSAPLSLTLAHVPLLSFFQRMHAASSMRQLKNK